MRLEGVGAGKANEDQGEGEEGGFHGGGGGVCWWCAGVKDLLLFETTPCGLSHQSSWNISKIGAAAIGCFAAEVVFGHSVVFNKGVFGVHRPL